LVCPNSGVSDQKVVLPKENSEKIIATVPACLQYEG
jgi:hypothetical protein